MFCNKDDDVVDDHHYDVCERKKVPCCKPKAIGLEQGKVSMAHIQTNKQIHKHTHSLAHSLTHLLAGGWQSALVSIGRYSETWCRIDECEEKSNGVTHTVQLLVIMGHSQTWN